MLERPIPRLLAEATAVGATFRLSGDEIVVTDALAIPVEVRTALKGRRDELFAHLASADTGVPTSSAILRAEGIEVAEATTESEAIELLAEMLTDAGDGPLGLDMETAPKPDYTERRVAIKLTRTGAVARNQPKDKSRIGLDPLRSDPRLVQVYGGGSRCVVFDMRSIPWSALEPLWRRRLVIHHAQFELGFLRARGILAEKFECTSQATGLMLGTHRRGLAVAAEAYLGRKMPKELQTSEWGATRLSEEQLAYAALDAVAALRLWAGLEADLKARDRWDAYLLQRNAILGAVDMELTGIGVDTDALDEEIEKWSLEIGDARAAWVEVTGTAPPATPAEVRTWLENNLDPEALASWPRSEKTRALSTAAGDLERAAHLPAIRPLLRLKSLDKLLSSFGPSLREAVHPITGRIHPNFLVAGTKSGRWSCRNPNMQQMPGDHLAPGFRRVFCAAPGRALVGADYSQMELRAAAEVSGDTALRKVYEDGADLHSITAAATAGISVREVTAAQRKQAKPVNFGSIYGMGARGLAAAAWNGYRIEMMEAEAQRSLTAFFGKFHRLGAWMRRHAEECRQKRRIVIGAGRVVEASWEPNGIRYTQCCNLPVQGVCADIMLRAVAGVHARMKAGRLDAHLIAQIHDELIVETAMAEVDAVAGILEDEMTKAFAVTFPDAPLLNLIDVKTGQSWADLK